MLRKTLDRHPSLDVRGELLLPAWKSGYVTQSDFYWAISSCGGFHLQRYQCRDGLDLQGCQIINLHRRDKLQQYLSLKLAMATDSWHQRSDTQTRLRFDEKEFKAWSRDWIEGKAKTDEMISRQGLNVIEVEYESLVDSIPLILDFLGVDRVPITPALQKLPSVNYAEIFDGLAEFHPT